MAIFRCRCTVVWNQINNNNSDDDGDSLYDVVRQPTGVPNDGVALSK